jgi:hypothetical protein
VQTPGKFDQTGFLSKKKIFWFPGNDITPYIHAGRSSMMPVLIAISFQVTMELCGGDRWYNYGV